MAYGKGEMENIPLAARVSGVVKGWLWRCCGGRGCFRVETHLLYRWKWKWKWKWKWSRVRLFATPWTVAHQAPPPMGFSRKEYWSRLPFPSPGDLPNAGIKPRSPTLQADSLTTEPPGKLAVPQEQVSSHVFFRSEVQASLLIPSGLQPAKGAPLLCVGSHDWGTQYVAWTVDSPGQNSTCVNCLFFWLFPEAQIPAWSPLFPSFTIHVNLYYSICCTEIFLPASS